MNNRKELVMNKKRNRLFLLCLSLALTVAGCTKPKDKEPEEVHTLHVGVMYSADIVPLAKIKEEGLDKAQGFTLDMQVFQSAKDRDGALQAGELDGVFTDYIGICIYQNAGLDLKITGVTDGDYQLAVNGGAGITSLSQCKGLSIGISENTLIEYTLDFLLEEQGYPPDFLKKEVVPKITDRTEQLLAGNLTMSLLPEPFATLVKEKGAVILGSANESGLYPAVSGFLSQTLEEKKETVKAFYRAYDEAVKLVNASSQEEMAALAINKAGFPEELRDTLVLPVYRCHKLPETGELRRAIAWCAKKGLCKESLLPETLLGEGLWSS